MQNVKPSTEPLGLQDAIDKLFVDISNVSPDSEEFALMVTNMDTLYKLKEVDAKIKSAKHEKISLWATVAANILGIGMIVGHERASVVTSKALSFVMKLK